MRGWWKDSPFAEVIETVLLLLFNIAISVMVGGYIGGIVMGIAICVMLVIICTFLWRWTQVRGSPRRRERGDPLE